MCPYDILHVLHVLINASIELYNKVILVNVLGSSRVGHQRKTANSRLSQSDVFNLKRKVQKNGYFYFLSVFKPGFIMKQHYTGPSVLYSAHANGVKCFKANTHHGPHTRSH